MAVELSSNTLLTSVHCLFGIGKWRETYWAHWSRLTLLTKLETRKTTSLLSGENLDLLVLRFHEAVWPTRVQIMQVRSFGIREQRGKVLCELRTSLV